MQHNSRVFSFDLALLYRHIVRRNLQRVQKHTKIQVVHINSASVFFILDVSRFIIFLQIRWNEIYIYIHISFFLPCFVRSNLNLIRIVIKLK